MSSSDRSQTDPAAQSSATVPLSRSDEALLIDRYRQLLRSAIRKMIHHANAYEIDDIEQEACARLLRVIRQRRDIRQMDSYVYRIGVTTAIDALRKIKRRQETLVEDVCQVIQQQPELITPATPDSRLETEQQLDVIQRAFSELNENRRAVVQLHLQGYTIEEIAGKLDWTEAKVRNLVYRGMDDLKHKLGSRG